MPSRAPLAGRSLHQWLIGLPVLGFVLTVFGFAMHASDGGADWLRLAFVANLALLVVGLMAGLAGLFDFLSIPPEHPARRVAWVHLGLNAVALGLAALNVLLHPREVMAVVEGHHLTLEAFHSTPSLWLTGVGVAVMSLSGIVGRMLVARHHVGVVWRRSKDEELVPTRPRTL